MKPDGTDVTQVTQHDLPGDRDFRWPNWSPDGTQLVFSNCDPGCDPECCGFTSEIHLVNADGTGHRRIVEGPESAVWSPDGFRLLAQSGARQVIVDVGGGEGRLTEIVGRQPDWQPILGSSGLVRPKGASPLRVSLVPTYRDCIEPGLKHGPALAEDSCGPPVQQTTRLTVGTPDANDNPAKSVSYLRLGVRRGNPATPADEADVRIRPVITDVRAQDTLDDYTGELGVRVSLRITDRNSASPTSGPGPATAETGTLAFTIPCSATVDTTVGATCESETTLEAFVPGAVMEQQRAVWELGAVRVFDAGADGDPSTADGDAPFLAQGVFIP
jgi:hypothetical protein